VTPLATVAIPVRNGGTGLAEVLAAVARQRVPGEVELLICDSGSTDGSAELARRAGARLLEIAPPQFSHGGTRNLLMQHARARHVAFLTQDAVPADDLWLSRLLAGFAVADGVGLVFGPYAPRPGASPTVTRELTEWFASFAPDGRPRVDRLDPPERALPPRTLLGPRGFFTDANGCVARDAWERVPFREIAYAEDQALAVDMLRAGFAKVYVPDARVVHSHEYSTWGWLQRSFDESRALHAVYGWRAPVSPRNVARNVWGSVGADRRWAAAGGRDSLSGLARSASHHLARAVGAALGARADRLPVSLRRRLSHERRAT
jgi:glycosyltransferase involved in cell wall biosynthesis